MKTSFFALLAASTLLAGNVFAQLVTNFDDLNYWGTGTNRTALVIQWNDSKSPDALAWGYRWSGTETVADMILFLAENDPRFFARIDSNGSGFGAAFFGFGYQTGSAAFGVTGAVDELGNPVDPLVFVDGINDLNTSASSTEAPAGSETAVPINAADRYVEGWWDNGFFSFYNSGTDINALTASFALPSSWAFSNLGASSVYLVDEGWAAFSFAPGFVPVGVSSTVTAAIPEPSSIALFGLGAGVLLWYRRRKSQHCS
jgi:hypothetical protein